MTQSEPEPHGSRDTFVPPPVKCTDDFIIEFDAALDKVTEEALSTTNNTMMTPSRWLQLTINGGHITRLERMEGWHYCPRLNDKLTKMSNNLCKLCGADQLPDTLVPPPEKLDKFGFPVRTLEQQLADLKESIDPDPLSLVVYDPNEPVPHLTDEQLTAALIKHQVEADAYDKNLAQEMKVALDSLTEEDIMPHTRPVLPNEQQLSDITVKTNPPIVHQHNDQWYFWEETYSQRIGPYSTEIAANKALDHYCDVVLGQGRDPS